MSLFSRAAAHYERIRHLLSGGETPDETLAFIYGYVDGEKGADKVHTDGFYYQGYRLGVAREADDDVKTDDTTNANRHGSHDDWCRI